MIWICVKCMCNVHLCKVLFFSFAVKEPGDVAEEDIPSIDRNQYGQLASAPWRSLELVRAFEEQFLHLSLPRS